MSDEGDCFAFPSKDDPYMYGGMTMRQYYAVHAPPLPSFMRESLVRQCMEKSGGDAPEAEKIAAYCMARWAFRYADEMIRVSRRKPDEP